MKTIPQYGMAKSGGRQLRGLRLCKRFCLMPLVFATRMVFLIEKNEIAGSPVYIILGQNATYKLDKTQYYKIKKFFTSMKLAITYLLNDGKLFKERPKKTLKRDPVVEEAIEQLGKGSDCEDKVKFFLTFARKLSLEAIHEGRELSFLLGFGHAEEPALRCCNHIPLPTHLSQERADLDLLVHFVKSHFSLFGHEDRILWFNQHARCQGLYERAHQDPKERWLEGWPEDCYFVRIKGKGKLDILNKEITGASKNQHRPRIRIKGDEVVDLKSLTDIRYRVMVAAAQVFISSDRAWWVIELLTKVVDRLREAAHEPA